MLNICDPYLVLDSFVLFLGGLLLWDELVTGGEALIIGLAGLSNGTGRRILVG